MKKKFLAVLILAAVMVLTAMSAVLTACSNEEEYPTWDVSAEGSSVTASFTDNGKYGYILTVEGSGAMQDYSSAADSPWYGKSGRVTELVIKDGVTNIGDNAFTYCYYAETVILPASVTEVGANAFPASSKVYGYATDITVGEGTTVYVYSESQPTTPGNFWHEVNGKPAVWPLVVTSAQKILFIGNSYTFYNNMPTLFEEIATAAGAEVTVEAITTGSQSLKNWANPKTEDGARVEAKLTSSSYDIIVLQEKSTSPVNDDYNYFVSGAKALAERIAETQDNCRIFLYETWGSPAYAGSYGGTVPVMESRLRTAYDNVAGKIGATVSYVGKAFTYIYQNYPDINLYNTEDKNHPSYEGSYLAACVHAASLLGINVENSDYNGTLDAETAKLLRQVGYSVAVGSDIPETTYDMEIAVYSRYADASVIANLVAAFKEDYATKNSVEAPKIKYSLLGANNTNVATFGGLVNDGNYDMILAAGNNINSDNGGGVSVKAKKSYWVKDSVYPNGSDSRYVCRLTENEIAVAFYNFMDTDAAKLILDPSYVPEDEAEEMTVNFILGDEPYGTPIILSSASSAEPKALHRPTAETGYVFKGWALSADETDESKIYSGNVTYATFADAVENGEVTLYAIFEVGEIEDLRIAVYHDTFDPELAAQLITAFEKWCEDKNIELNGTMYLQLSTTTQGDYSKAAVNGGYNIAIGFRANSFVSSTPIKDIVIKGISTNRRIALLVDDDIAHEFYYNFMESGVAKKILNEDYITEDEADKIIITFMNGDVQYGETLTVSNATDAKAKTLPAIDDEKFKGWATEDGETVLKGNISYADVESLATSGELTLYAKFSSDENPYSLTVAFHLGNNYITEQEVKAVIDGFKETLKGTEYENADIEAVKIADNGVTDANKAVNGNSAIDVYVGGGNMDNANNNGVNLDSDYGKEDVKSGVFTNTSRKVGILDGKADNQLAVLFYQYITGTTPAEGE